MRLNQRSTGLRRVSRSPSQRSIASEAHVGRGLRVRVGAYVDQRGLAAFHGALERWANLVGLLDEFAVAAERLYHLVVTLVAEVAADVAAGLARGEASVVRDDDNDIQLVPNRGVHFHPVPAKSAVTAEHHDRLVRRGSLGAEAERDTHTHASVRPGVEAEARLIDGNRLAREVEDFMAIDDQDSVAGNR